MERPQSVDLKSRLTRLLREKSYREGDFTLASGKKSRFYLDAKVTTLHPEGADLIGRLAIEILSAQGLFNTSEIEGVGGMSIGADPIATSISLAAYSKGILWPAFMVRKESKGHGTNRFTEGVENLKSNARLLVVEDVVTTGGSSILAIERLKMEGFLPHIFLSVVDREEGGRSAIEAAGLRFFSLVALAEIRKA